MYQENELKKLYERLKAQYPQYELEFSGDSLTLNRPYSKIQVNRDGVKLYVNEKLYDQISSADVDDLDDLYELIEAFLLDLKHAGMKQGNETYIAAAKQAARMGSRFLILPAMCLTAVMIGLMATNNPWLFFSIFILLAVSFVALKQIRKRIFQRYWICPACGQSLPMGRKWHYDEIEYVSQCPCCGYVLEQPPELEPVQTEYAPSKPLEPVKDLPAPGSKWPCLISGGITAAFALFLLPLIFIPDGNETLDMTGVGIGAALLLFLLGAGLMLLFCRCAEPEEMRQPIVIVRERKVVTVLGIILWAVGLLLTLMGIIVAGIPPFEAAVTAVLTIPGALLFLLGVWMLLAGCNRSLFVFRNNAILYISSFGRKREFEPGQAVSVCLTVNRSIHLLDKGGKKLISIETNMRGIPRFAEWIESADLAAVMTPAMENQAKQEQQQEMAVQWREEYRTHWHDHIRGIRIGLWIVMLFFAVGTLVPLPLLLFAGLKFRTVTMIAALAPVPFLIFCLVFAPVLLFGDRPENATPEWNAMHIKVPLIPALLTALLYMGQVHYIWDGFLLQEADTGFGWLAHILIIGAVLTVPLIVRIPKRMRLEAGLFMGMISFCLAIGFHYYINAALSGPAHHYPAVIVDSHADDPDVDDDDYELTIVMDNGEEAEIVVLEQIYKQAIDGEPLEVCHRESPFGVILLDIHVPKQKKEE